MNQQIKVQILHQGKLYKFDSNNVFKQAAKLQTGLILWVEVVQTPVPGMQDKLMREEVRNAEMNEERPNKADKGADHQRAYGGADHQKAEEEESKGGAAKQGRFTARLVVLSYVNGFSC